MKENSKMLSIYLMRKLVSCLMVLVFSMTSVFASTTPYEIKNYANQIDAELNQEYTKINVKPNSLINDDQFVRRAYLSIAGRIPTLAEYDAWNKVNSSTKRTDLVKHLVDSSAYTSNMYNFWADLLRLREKINNVNFLNGSIYISYIKDQIAKNVSYDQFVKDLLLSKGEYFTNPAVGYYERDQGMPLDNFIATSKVFLGTDMTCSQCHDDPFQDWTQKQFYQMAAYFYSAEATGRKNPAGRDKIKELRLEAEEIIKKDPSKRGLNNQISNFLSATLASVNVEPKKKLTLPHDYRYKDANPNSVVEPKVLFGESKVKSNSDDPREDAVEWMISPTNKTFTKNIVNRYWGFIFGANIVPNANNIYESDKLNSALLTKLADIFISINYNTKVFVQIICSTQLFQRADYLGVPKDNFVFIGPVFHRLSSEQLWDSVLSVVIDKPEYFTSSYADDYRNIMNVQDFAKIKLNDVQEMIKSLNEANTKKYYTSVKYKGYNLIRASEVNDLSSNETMLKQLGKSDHELISSSSKDGSVTQIISLVNGPLVDIVNMSGSVLNNNLKGKSPDEKVEIAFNTILSRKPNLMEKNLFSKNGTDDLVFALINTNEFKFSN